MKLLSQLFVWYGCSSAFQDRGVPPPRRLSGLFTNCLGAAVLFGFTRAERSPGCVCESTRRTEIGCRVFLATPIKSS